MQDFTQTFKVFWRIYGAFATLMMCIVFVILLGMWEGSPSLLSVLKGKLCAENFFGIAIWLVMILAFEPIVTPHEHHQSWQFQKIFWTVALVLFYLFVFVSGYMPSDLTFLAPFGVYLLRMFIPYQWVKKWTLIFIEIDAKKC